jgi:hypothetical protein
MTSEPLVIFTRTYDFLSWLVPHTEGFPRAQRFVVTRRLQDAALDFQEHNNRNNNMGFRVVVSHNSPDPAGNAVRLCESPERRRRAGRPRRKREMARPFPGRACVRREPGAGRANIERVRLLGACPEPDRRSRREVES